MRLVCPLVVGAPAGEGANVSRDLLLENAAFKELKRRLPRVVPAATLKLVGEALRAACGPLAGLCPSLANATVVRAALTDCHLLYSFSHFVLTFFRDHQYDIMCAASRTSTGASPGWAGILSHDACMLTGRQADAALYVREYAERVAGSLRRDPSRARSSARGRGGGGRRTSPFSYRGRKPSLGSLSSTRSSAVELFTPQPEGGGAHRRVRSLDGMGAPVDDLPPVPPTPPLAASPERPVIVVSPPARLPDADAPSAPPLSVILSPLSVILSPPPPSPPSWSLPQQQQLPQMSPGRSAAAAAGGARRASLLQREPMPLPLPASPRRGM